MNYSTEHIKQERNDRWKSAIITFLVTLLLFLVIFSYQFTRIIPIEDKVTTMLINFGNSNEEVSQKSEAEDKEGSKSMVQKEMEVPKKMEIKEIPNLKPLEKTVKKEEKKPTEKSVVKEKLITGKSPKIIPEKNKEKSPKKVDVKKGKSLKQKPKTETKTAIQTSNINSKEGNGDGKGMTAVGNLLKGRGQKIGSQGTSSEKGNAGDPLGGDHNGDSKIGVDRRLISFIPGTMGQGGVQPSHHCTASGTITIAYTVDKTGNVVSANRLGGASDACVISTSISWVKRYVKAERANTSSTGTYKITF